MRKPLSAGGASRRPHVRALLALVPLLFARSIAGLAADAAPQVRIDSGALAGGRADGVASFKGIPYAAPPVGVLRWKPPQAPSPWKDLRPALSFGADCMQEPFPGDAAPLGVTPAEDCLYANVWAPLSARAGAKLPVMVWIYGGGFANGGASPAVYDGSEFARHGVVMVSFNYRLAHFGFFAHPALSAEQSGGLLANYGLMDQLAALQWVKRNIAAFGGDPGNVTVFGESAGGMSVHVLMTTPLARGLFHKAIIESGAGRGGLRDRPLSGGPESAEGRGLAFATKYGIEGEGAEALARLRAIPAAQIAKGLHMMTIGADPTYVGGPVVDGRLVRGSPVALYAAGEGANVPVLVGANSADIGFAPGRTLDELFAAFGADAAAARAAYNPENSDNLRLIAGRIGGDLSMIEPARKVAQTLAARGQSVYEFRFSYVAESMRKDWAGAPHATEIPYVFNTVAARYGKDLTPADAAIAKTAIDYWTQFAKTGVPRAAGAPAWPRYQVATDQLLDFTTNGPVAKADPWKARLDLIDARQSAPVADAAALERRVESLLSRMTQREKITLMSGGSSFGTAAIERLGIPALSFADGPNGVRSNNDEVATVFPTGAGLAATWNPAVAKAAGAAIGREAKALGVHVLLGPNVNIQRTPLAGRNFEAYSEDPYLAGQMGVGFVTGVQSQGVGTSPKHFVANEQELERLRSSSNVDERALREIYLAPFETIVRDAKPWTLMAAYNRVNGVYMTENSALLRGVLKGEWGFDGVLMSDWGAVHSTATAANSGTDLEMPGPPRYFGAALLDAARTWQVEPPVVDDAARRMLRLIVRTGALDAKPLSPGRHASGAERSTEAALDAAREAITLLRNESGALPLERASLQRLAVIGPNADVPLQQGGGSAAVVPAGLTTPLAAIREAAGRAVSVSYAPGVDNDVVPPPADFRMLSTDASRKQPGLQFAYYAGEKLGGTPYQSGVENYFDKTMFAAALTQMAGRWEGWFWPTSDGVHEFRLATRGAGTLSIDGTVIIGKDAGTPLPAESDFQDSGKVASLRLAKGRGYRIRIDYVSLPVSFHQMHFGIRLPEPAIEDAVRIARAADAAVVFVGVSRTSESEGRDRTTLALVGRQNELVEAVLAANPRTIVVLNNGAPLDLPWAAKAPAILEAWLPGQGGATALAQLLFGDANPSGKLPFTFPRRLEDNPSYLYYSAGRDANYGEGVFVGYRYYEKRAVAPLFAFGHGLSYTRFEYSNLRVPASVAAGPIDVTLDVKNVGTRAGGEVVQLYVGDAATTVLVRPVKELKRFAKLKLAPGETRSVHFTLSARDLAYYDVHVKDWIATPGMHRVLVGSSSADIRLQQDFQWTAAADRRVPSDARATFSD